MIDVVVPVLNNPGGIRRVLACLADQSLSFDEFSVVVVDNGSRDETPKAVRSMRDDLPFELDLIEYDEVQTSYAARNQGIKNSDASHLAFTDSDCLPKRDWLKNGRRTLEQSDAGLAPGRIVVTFENDEPNLWEYLDASLKFNQDRYVEEGWGATANLFVKRDCFERHGPFRDDLVSGGDGEFGRRVTGAGETITYAEDAVVEHPARNTLSSVLKKEIRIAKGHQQLHDESIRDQPLSWTDFVPQPWVPPLEGVTLSFWDKLSVITGFNIVRLTYSFTRLFTPLNPFSRDPIEH